MFFETIVIDLILGSFWAFGWPKCFCFFGVRVRFKNCLWFYSCSWTTFIFYVSFNSDFWCWPNFLFVCLFLGLFMDFWGPTGLFWGLGSGRKTVFGSTHIVQQLFFSMFPSILILEFDIILGVGLAFWGLMPILWQGKFSKNVLRSYYKAENFHLCASFNYNLCFWSNSWFFWSYWG